MKTDIGALRKSDLFAEEAFVVEIQSMLETIMHEKGLTRAKLAEAMGVSRPRVTQMFSDDCTNFTIRLLARALHAMGERLELTCETHRKVKRRGILTDAMSAMNRYDGEWSAAWEHATRPANDHCVVRSSELQVSGDGERRVEALVAKSLQRASDRRVAA